MSSGAQSFGPRASGSLFLMSEPEARVGGSAFTRREDVEHEAGGLIEHGEQCGEARAIAFDPECTRRQRLRRGELAQNHLVERGARHGDRRGRRVRPLAQAMAQGAMAGG